MTTSWSAAGKALDKAMSGVVFPHLPYTCTTTRSLELREHIFIGYAAALYKPWVNFRTSCPLHINPGCNDPSECTELYICCKLKELSRPSALLWGVQFTIWSHSSGTAAYTMKYCELNANHCSILDILRKDPLEDHNCLSHQHILSSFRYFGHLLCQKLEKRSSQHLLWKASAWILGITFTDKFEVDGELLCAGCDVRFGIMDLNYGNQDNGWLGDWGICRKMGVVTGKEAYLKRDWITTI